MNTKEHFLNNKAPQQQPFAEVIISSLDSFTAQCWQWDNFPRFGSLIQVKAQGIIIFGCVTQVKAGSLDPMRTPVAYRKTEEELKAEQPQIFEFLTTTFDVQVIGYSKDEETKEHKKFYYTLPPYPCKIHAFVQESSTQVMLNFFSDASFLHVLFAFQNKILNLDELLLAIIYTQTSAGILNQEHFNNFCETFSLLNGNDYRRLKLFLKRVEQATR